MYNELIRLIKQNFDIDIIKIEVLMEHTYSKVYLLESLTDKFALKQMGENNELENESSLNNHLVSKGIKVPKIYYTVTGNHIVYSNGLMYILYEFIEGKTHDFHSVSAGFLIKQAQTLGEIQNALKDYKQFPLCFGQGFHTKEKCMESEQSNVKELRKAEEKNDAALVAALSERLKHIRKISDVEIDCGKLTYVNSHGDFYLSQIIERNGELVTIDWTHPGYLPACLEVMMSYIYAAPECKDGTITIDNFKPYLREYLKYTELNKYDLQIMPYFMYFYCIFCSFTPPYDDLQGDYYKIAHITDNLANWLYGNAEKLSYELCKLKEESM